MITLCENSNPENFRGFQRRLKMHSHGQHQGTAGEAIFAIGEVLSCKPTWFRRWHTVGDRMRGAIAELIGEIKIESFPRVPNAKAEEIPVHIRRQWCVKFVRH